MFIFFLKLLTSYLLVVNSQNPINTMDMNERIYVEGYFIRYGYTTPKLQTDENVANKEMARAIKEFQWFAGLQTTGIMNKETKDIMQLPRCGVADKINPASMMKRKKRYIHQGAKWEKSTLTYRITKYSRKLSKTEVDSVIREAFRIWSKHTNLYFKPEYYNSKVDIEIQFGVKNHGDGFTFDGPRGTLAHAFYPDNGDTHFDDDEDWSASSSGKGISLLHTAVHELGHALGLSHSNEKNAIMYFAYTKPPEPVDLQDDDIIGIQNLYGTPRNYQPVANPTLYPVFVAPTSKPEVITSRPTVIPYESIPDICKDASIDAVTQTQDGSIWMFKGYYTWKVNENIFEKPTLVRIQNIWKVFSGPVDAALTLQDGSTYIFTEDYVVWKFRNQEPDKHFPQYRKHIFFNLPDRGPINAAFIWGTSGKPYFIIGDKIWTHEDVRTHRKEALFTINEVLPGFSEPIDAAFLWQNGNNQKINYFFVKNKYYKYDSSISALDTNSPKENSIRWLGCPGNSKFQSPMEYENGGKQQTQSMCDCPCSATINLLEVKVIVLFTVVFMIYFNCF